MPGLRNIENLPRRTTHTGILGSAEWGLREALFTLGLVGDREGDAEFHLSHAWVAKHTRSGLCYTISSAQGRRISGELGVFDTEHPRWSLRHLYTALSRATAAALLSIES